MLKYFMLYEIYKKTTNQNNVLSYFQNKLFDIKQKLIYFKLFIK